MVSLSARAEDGLQRTQSISLGKGWNAVFLEVEPVDTSPAKVFAGLPVDKAATLFENPVSNQFVTDSTINLSTSSGWGIWYSGELPESFLRSLDAIHGNRAYLVHATAPCQWNVLGEVERAVIDWKPDAYNFVGFSVRSPGGPTFAEFFAGSPAHRGQKIYRLVNARWKQVLQPATEAMRSGEAFWIFCDGPSNYQGPLTVETPLRQGLSVGRGDGELILRNACPHPLGLTIHHVPGVAGGVPLSVVVSSVGDPANPISAVGVPMPSGTWQQALPPLEVGGSVAVPFECRSGDMLKAEQATLLKITTDLGSENWVPVRGFRDDLND
ncbi:hypothetical protein [Haloferula sp. A504]|uniref:hypothetical protein n=1 Tax=Haloferula sp. A504 TaxID=3373601 RepID=UPI0031C0FACE|nr:hypothetical protein [Verrucomicrobiaceae bacterium E54]